MSTKATEKQDFFMKHLEIKFSSKKRRDVPPWDFSHGDVRTKFLAASIFLYNIICWVESRTPEQVTDFGAIDLSVATVPEVKKVEDFSYVWKTNSIRRMKMRVREKSTLVSR